MTLLDGAAARPVLNVSDGILADRRGLARVAGSRCSSRAPSARARTPPAPRPPRATPPLRVAIYRGRGVCGVHVRRAGGELGGHLHAREPREGSWGRTGLEQREGRGGGARAREGSWRARSNSGCRSPFLAVAALCGVAAVNAHRNAPETLHKAREEAEAARAIGAAANGCPLAAAEATRDAPGSACPILRTHGERARGGEAHLTSSEVELDASTRATDAHADADARSTLSLFSSRDFLAVSGLNAALFFSGARGRATLLPLLAAQDY